LHSALVLASGQIEVTPIAPPFAPAVLKMPRLIVPAVQQHRVVIIVSTLALIQATFIAVKATCNSKAHIGRSIAIYHQLKITLRQIPLQTDREVCEMQVKFPLVLLSLLKRYSIVYELFTPFQQ